MWATLALTGLLITRTGIGSTGVAVASLTAFLRFGKSPIVRSALITVTTDDVALTDTFARVGVTAEIVDGSETITGTS